MERMTMLVQLVLVAAIVSMMAGICTAHGRLWDPPGRSTMWRVGFLTPPNYDDNQLFCGGFDVQWNQNGGQCGICGDNYADAQPRENEAGGLYGNGVIVKTYTQGEDIDVHVELTATHMGWMEFRICPNNNVNQIATQACLDQYILQKADNSGARILVDNNIFHYNEVYKLPAGLTCSQCVIQWKYHAGNNWGCDNEGICCLGCGGPQEEFYACADVEILGSTNVTTDNPVTTTTVLTTTVLTTSTTSESPAGQCAPSETYANSPGMTDWCLANCFPPPGVAINCPSTHCNDACRGN